MIHVDDETEVGKILARVEKIYEELFNFMRHFHTEMEKVVKV